MNLKRSLAGEFVWLLEQCRLGRLWLLVEYAPLACQSPRLLEEALYLKHHGLVVALAQPLPQPLPQFAAGAAQLPSVPPRRVEYLGVTLEELDLTAVLELKPQVAVVANLGHANPPGSAHPQRWQEAQALLAAGISVLATVNLTDMEGALKEAAESNAETGLPLPPDPRHSVPESFWRSADLLEVEDLPVSETLTRLAEGPACPGLRPEMLGAGQLERLRRCALELAQGAAAPKPTGERHAASGGRVMVCLASLSPRGHFLLERGRELARRLETGWFVVQVHPPGEEAPSLPGSLLGLGQGAELVQLSARDPVAALMDFARAHGVGHIILGRSLRPWWRQVFGRSPMLRLVQEATGFDLHIVEAADLERHS